MEQCGSQKLLQRAISVLLRRGLWLRLVVQYSVNNWKWLDSHPVSLFGKSTADIERKKNNADFIVQNRKTKCMRLTLFNLLNSSSEETDHSAWFVSPSLCLCPFVVCLLVYRWTCFCRPRLRASSPRELKTSGTSSLSAHTNLLTVTTESGGVYIKIRNKERTR